MAPQNQAAWLDGKDKKLRVADSEYPRPGADDIVVRVHATAVNPIDWKIQDSGRFIKEWPMILGCDAAGEVVEVGSNVQRFKKGDRVTGHAISLATNDPTNGSFQLYVKLQAAKSAILPEKISYVHGSVLPLAVDTAAVGLFAKESLALPSPSLNPKSSGKIAVVWGGSSSVGALAIQLAAASGTKTIAVASSRNHDFVKGLGADQAFDYKSGSVVRDVVKAVKDSGLEFAGVYDAISIQDQSLKYTVPILEQLGGGVLAVTLAPPQEKPDSIKPYGIFAINDMVHTLWENYVTKALEEGKLKAVPEPLVIGKGLESVQKGLDKNKAGVSAKKVVIDLS